MYQSEYREMISCLINVFSQCNSRWNILYTFKLNLFRILYCDQTYRTRRDFYQWTVNMWIWDNSAQRLDERRERKREIVKGVHMHKIIFSRKRRQQQRWQSHPGQSCSIDRLLSSATALFLYTRCRQPPAHFPPNLISTPVDTHTYTYTYTYKYTHTLTYTHITYKHNRKYARNHVCLFRESHFIFFFFWTCTRQVHFF